MENKKIPIIIISVIFLLGLLYIGPAYYYSHVYGPASEDRGYMYGTYINGVYCTGMSIDEALSVIPKDYVPVSPKLVLEDDEYELDLEKIGYVSNYKAPLERILDEQNPLTWYKQLLSDNRNRNVIPDITIDKEGLNSYIDSLKLGNKRIDKDEVYIELTQNGYELFDGKKPVLDIEKLKSYIWECIEAGDTEIVVDDSFYDGKDYTADEEKLIAYFDELESYQRRLVTYVFGKETKRISKREWAELMNTGEPVTKITPGLKGSENISFTIDEKKAVDFIDDFLDEYNTYNNRYFTGHNGARVHVTKGNYGNKLDISREEKWFKEFVNSGQDYATRTPVYLIEAKHREKNDFGDTFIEVSLDEQYMWYYVDGEIYVETPVTTGSYAHGGTDPRVVYVYTKIPNKWLTGPTWHSFVKYWVAIQGAIGIHDASWRSVYGGDEYKYNGSHGCINTPEEAMKKIYDKVEIGTPVIVYSIEKNGVKDK